VNAGGSANGEQNEEDGETDYTPPDDFGLLALQNRPPWWNVELGAFVLNFGGRVSVASVKNFQLCDRNDQDHIMLQFGRIQGRHSFTMDFQHPLTAVQAFAIAISSLQSRISFG
jgi:tubby-related protein 1